MNTVGNEDRVVVNAAARFTVGSADYVYGSAAPEIVDARVDEPAPVEVDERPAPVDRPDRVRTTAPRRIRRARGGTLTLDEITRRDRVAARRRRRVRRGAALVGDVATQTARGSVVLVRSSATGFGRWLWMPERKAAIERIEDAAVELRRREDLSTARRVRAALVLGATGGGWFALPPLWRELVETMPVWGWSVSGVGAAAGCWVLGRWTAPEVAEGQAVDIPEGLAEGMTERRVRATLGEAFAEIDVRARVGRIVASTWGWEVHAELVDPLTGGQLSRMALYLDTRRGGLLVSGVSTSERTRIMRMVMVDLLGQGQVSEPLALTDGQDIHTPIPLAPRFDGATWRQRLAAVHLVVFGRTGSGKTTVLHTLLDGFTQAGAVVGCIDLSGGVHLTAWAPVLEPRLCAFGPDAVAAASDALARVCAIVADRKARLAPNTEWRSTRAEPPIRLVIDEYALASAHAEVLEQVIWLLRYGRQGDGTVVLAAHGPTKDMMRDSTANSQAQIKIMCGMDASAAVLLPKAMRDQGVAPELYQPAIDDEPNDAGRAFVVGAEPVPFAVRFPPVRDGEAVRRAEALAAGRGRGRFSAADERVIDSLAEQDAGVPPILLAALVSIQQHGAGRAPERATSAEIAGDLVRQGYQVDANTLTRKLKSALGDAYSDERTVDMNLPGGNHKGWTLPDLRAAVARYQAQHGV